MQLEQLIHYFFPAEFRDRLHPEYDQVRTVVTGMLTCIILLTILPVPLFFFPHPVAGYYLMAASCILTLLVLKGYGIYWIPVMVTLLIGYFVVTGYALRTGGMASPNVTALYMLLLTGFWANRKIGVGMIFGNMIALTMVYYISPQTKDYSVYTLVFHLCLTVFFGSFFWLVQQQHDLARQQIREQQHFKIDNLNHAVKERTDQLLTMRQNLATDFHDETGNILSAITRQAGILKLKTGEDPSLSSLVDNIILNSEQLYSSSKDFLWSMNNNSDDPGELFSYLTSFGQVFYNQFDIAFSVNTTTNSSLTTAKLFPFASRHIIFIFKEAMTNVARHAGAREVILEMALYPKYICIALQDDGCWKEPQPDTPHSGLLNMEKRSNENNFRLNVYGSMKGTRLQLDAPVRINTFEA